MVPKPLFHYDAYNFFVEFYDEPTQKTTQKELSTIDLKIIELIRENPAITREQLSKNIENITADGIKYYMRALTKNKIIKREGGRKVGKWIIIGENQW